MSKLKYWQDKIKEKKKETNFSDFLMQIVSWSPIILHKKNWIITRYPESDRIKKVLSNDDFEEIRDNLTDSWVDYNFNKWFFENFWEFMKQSYFPARIVIVENENCDYSDIVLWSKNAYLSNVIINNCENILYWMSIKDNCTYIVNSCMVFNNSEICHMTFWIINSFKIFYSRFINNSNNIWFSTNLVWCSECILCDSLENQKYCIENKKYEKNIYLEKKKELLKNKQEYSKIYSWLKNIWNNVSTTNSTWNFLVDCDDVENWYNCYWVKTWRNIILIWWEIWNEDIYDVFQAGSPSWDDMYWVTWAWRWVKNLFNSCNVNGWVSVFYSTFMEDCSYCIWCIWLRGKSYCILNKQYNKIEWEKLADKIFTSMESDWILWDFFPANLNPFYFNDTMAHLIWNFKEEQIKDKWYMRREHEIKVDIPEWSNLIKTTEINKYQWYDSYWNWKINPEILNKVIEDKKGNYYRIVQMEYDFLKKYSLPIPEIHWMDRLKENFGV